MSNVVNSFSNLADGKLPGHWLLAKVGKKILRPGGIEMTKNLLNTVDFNQKNIVEFAPGLGYTANLILNNKIKNYIGIEANLEATLISQRVIGARGQVINVSATDSGITENSIDIVIGEAMLSMQTDQTKLAIMNESQRILNKGGFYLIHELGLIPDSINQQVKNQIQKELSKIIRVNARPLTIAEWTALLNQAGFKVLKTYTNKMSLLEPRRLITDEGILGVLKILKNIISKPEIRARVFAMKKCFATYSKELCAVGIIAEKI